MTSATGFPKRVIRIGRPVRLTRSRTARHVALNFEIVVEVRGAMIAAVGVAALASWRSWSRRPFYRGQYCLGKTADRLSAVLGMAAIDPNGSGLH